MAAEKSKRKKATASEPAPRPWRGAAFSLGAAFLALSAVGSYRGAGWMRGKLADRPELQLSGMDLHVSAPPAWLKADVGERIAQDAGWRAGSFDLSENGLVERIARRFAKSPWIEAVRIEKGFHSLRATLQYRRPILFVPVGDRGFYASADGTVLPAEDVARTALMSCLGVEGMQVARVPSLGERVNDARWPTIVRITELLGSNAEKIDATAILIESDGRGTNRYFLRTSNRRRIFWGPPLPSDEATAACRIPGILEQLKAPGSLGDDLEPKPIDATR